MRTKILLVEDDPVDLRFIKQALEAVADGLEIDTAKDGLEALEKLQSENAHCIIILDLNMPRMDGRQLLSKIKGDNELKVIPIIILSTSDSNEDIEGCYRQNANAYLVKPDTPEGYLRTAETIKSFWLDTAKLVH